MATFVVFIGFLYLDRDSAQPWRIQVQLLATNQKLEEKRSIKQKKEKEQGCEIFATLRICLPCALFKFLALLNVSAFLLFDFCSSFSDLFPICPCNSLLLSVILVFCLALGSI